MAAMVGAASADEDEIIGGFCDVVVAPLVPLEAPGVAAVAALPTFAESDGCPSPGILFVVHPDARTTASDSAPIAAAFHSRNKFVR